MPSTLRLYHYEALPNAIPRIARIGMALAAFLSAGCGSDQQVAGLDPITTGSLAVGIDGLPPGVLAPVVVTGPQGFQKILTRSQTLDGLTSGRYAIAASEISSDGDRFIATPASQSIAVPSGTTPVTASVSYQLVTGRMVVSVSGLPAGVNAAVQVSGPVGFVHMVVASETLTGLVPGSYAVLSPTQVVNGDRYDAPATSQDIVVAAVPGPGGLVAVHYAVSSGALSVIVEGLPAGADAAIGVTGPQGFHAAVAGSATLSGLEPGNYAISAGNVTAGGLVFLPSVTEQGVSVLPSLVPSVRTVTYTLGTGALIVTLSGLPGSVPGSVTVSGPGGFVQSITATQTLTGLIPGTYTVSGFSVSGGLATYNPVPASQSVSVSIGSVVSVGVTYSPVVGSLLLTVSGLPGGTSADVTVTGPGGYSQHLIGSQTLTGLLPGSYTISSVAVVSGGTTYTPTPALQSLNVSAGALSPGSVFYTGATLNLTINGVYLTQATQRPDGSVPLVAGRNAYLRVFAVANQSNSAQPQVRVRLYNGASLVQTYTVSAPAAGVPTAVNEGSLASSWNVLVPAALVQPNLKLLADVDPASTTAESDESDNQFPLTGVPGAVVVRTLPTFQVRLVPVLQQVNGLQGNVTAANANSFLPDLLQQLPVGAYDADVRAPYTTTAPVLQNDNANGAWGTILSEMLAVRAADASNRYYYGVVKTTYGSGVAGMGYVGGTARAAIGWDNLPSGSGVMAHEVGHNMGRQHAPCGGAASPDPGYPYAGGKIGMWGLDLTTLILKSPATYADLMGYCGPTWISDYNWSAMVTYRQGGPNNAPPVAADTPGLLVWGRVTDAGIVLEPAFRVPAAAGQAPSPGANRLELLAADGSLLRTVGFDADVVADLPSGTERHFAFVVPLDPVLERDLAGLRVRAGIGAAARLATLATGDPSPTMTRANSQQIEIRWDATRYPMVMVRDAVTGDILSLARGGSARLWARGSSFVLHFSDGVKSVVRQGRVLQ